LGDWKALMAVPRFRGLWTALLCANLASWSVLTALPILVAERYGAGGALVVSLSWRILPKILLAPVSGVLLRRLGAPSTACFALLGEAALTAVLPWCGDFTALQIVIAGVGALDAFMMPALMSLRGTVSPKGMELAGNSLCSMAERIGKTAGPAIGGLALLGGVAPAFLGFGIVTAMAAIPAARLPRALPEPASRGWAILRMPIEFWRVLRGDHVTPGLLICAVAYMVMLGGLRPFLFWANHDWFGGADTAWTGLMAAQGAGAMIGALAAGAFNRALLRRASAYMLTMVFAICEGLLYLLFLVCPSGAAGILAAMAILAMAGIPEVISASAWFSALQQRLSPARQGLFFAFTVPLWDCGYAIGVMSAGLHAAGILGLGLWWTMLVLTATLPILPLLAWDTSRRPVELA
jgi:predicted MFS family arabinose efflux permease